jgi:hypothetical protein
LSLSSKAKERGRIPLGALTQGGARSSLTLISRNPFRVFEMDDEFRTGRKEFYD